MAGRDQPLSSFAVAVMLRREAILECVTFGVERNGRSTDQETKEPKRLEAALIDAGHRARIRLGL